MDCSKNFLQLVHSGVVGAIWSAPPCRLYSTLRKKDGGPPPLINTLHEWPIPGITPQQLQQVQESQEIHRRSLSYALLFFNNGVLREKNNPSTPSLGKNHSTSGFFANVHATSSLLLRASGDHRLVRTLGHCSHFRKSIPWPGNAPNDYLTAHSSVLSLAEYPSAHAAAIIDIIKPWASQSSVFNLSLTTWRSLLAKTPMSDGPRITDGAGNSSSANWTIPKTKEIFKDVRKRWTARTLRLNLRPKFSEACSNHQAEPFIDDKDVLPLLHDLQQCFFLLCSLRASGNQTQRPMKMNQNYKSAMTTGPVQTMNPILHVP